MAHSHHSSRAHHVSRSRVHHIMGHKQGGAAHSDEAADRKLIKKMLAEHEAKEAKMEGHKAGGRLDKYARGGKIKGKHHTQVNIAVVTPHHRGSPSPGGPAGAGAALPPPPLPGGLPPGGPPMPPPGMGGGMPPPPPGGGMMKRGGRAYKRGGKVHMTAGAESGEGRLQKAHLQKKQKH